MSPSRVDTTVRRTASSRGWAEVEQLNGSRHRVRMEGWFGPNWLACLCSELGERGISIERATARRGGDATWVAELDVVALSGAVNPLEVRYVELTDSSVQQSVRPLQLLRYSLEDIPEHGSLLISIEAFDVVGLLGNMLGQLAMLLLFPVELYVETRGDRAYDSFVIGGLGERTPARARESVEKLLRRACDG